MSKLLLAVTNLHLYSRLGPKKAEPVVKLPAVQRSTIQEDDVRGHLLITAGS